MRQARTTISSKVIDAVDVLAELEELGISHSSRGESSVEILVKCPFHPDSTPSCAINTSKKVFKCHAASCGASGDILSFVSRVVGKSRKLVEADAAERYGVTTAAIAISSQLVEKYHARVWDAGQLLTGLRARGVTDEIIRENRLGFDGRSITIPVTLHGDVVNIRHYVPGGPSHSKFRSSRNRGAPLLYPEEQLRFDRIILCGGEIKALVTAARVNSRGFGAISTTAGEGLKDWPEQITDRLNSKAVWVCYDVDEAGILGAETACRALFSIVSELRVVRLPLDTSQFPHGDINDYFAVLGKTTRDFTRLLDSSELWSPPSAPESIAQRQSGEEKPTEVHLSRATHPDNVQSLISSKAVVNAICETPCILPRDVSVICDKSSKFCVACWVNFSRSWPKVTATIQPEWPVLAELVDAQASVQQRALQIAFKIPISCKAVEFRPTSFYTVTDAFLSPRLEIAHTSGDSVTQPALFVRDSAALNEEYEVTGVVVPRPRDQRSVFIVRSARPIDDALSTYRPSKDDLRSLRGFMARDDTEEAVAAKFHEIYDDMSKNVTRIFFREHMHMLVDLAFHSPLLINFDGSETRGWIEVLILGDSSQGKTALVTRMIDHYQLGEIVSCKNATVAGLLGGVRQIGNRWYVSWGVIPTHDKRLIVLEELKGADVSVLAKLTDMRSSGIAELPKIEKRRTFARTRLVCISNPRGDKEIGQYNYGVEAIRELIGSPEDIRRFDVVMAASLRQIDSARINEARDTMPRSAPHFSQQMCKHGVLWAWTRGPDRVRFTREAVTAISDAATRLCSEFTEQIPIIDRGSARFKIARLSAAVAARLFSTPRGDEETLLVGKHHVHFVSTTLRELYNDQYLGYAQYSATTAKMSEAMDDVAVKNRVIRLRFARDFVENALTTHYIELRDVCDWCSMLPQDASELISLLVRKRAMRRNGRGYEKTRAFTDLLKDMRSDEKIRQRAEIDSLDPRGDREEF